jgi:hypothetical protein
MLAMQSFKADSRSSLKNKNKTELLLARITRNNLKPGANDNGAIVSNSNAAFDNMSVGDGVDAAVMMLREKRDKTGIVNE